MKSACLKGFEICTQILDNWFHSLKYVEVSFLFLCQRGVERRKRINSLMPHFRLKFALVDKIYYWNSMILFTTIWIVFFFSCVSYAFFYTFFFYYWINTRRQIYKKFLISLNWVFLRDISQKLVELPFQWCNPFCTYQQDKKIEFRTKEGLLENYLQRWSFEYCLQQWDYS